jgi:hypothetical protein
MHCVCTLEPGYNDISLCDIWSIACICWCSILTIKTPAVCSPQGSLRLVLDGNLCTYLSEFDVSMETLIELFK